jgi:Domain of unknown function (DUF4189)
MVLKDKEESLPLVMKGLNKMSTLYRISVALLLLSLSHMVAAQQCPPGYWPLGSDQAGWKDCAPMTPNQLPPDPGPQWETRWGAIATADGAFGTGNSLTTKRKAEKQAIAQCRENGGKGCKVRITYYNQCGALAWGETSGTTFRSPQIADAEQSALKECSAKTTDCKIFFSGCSYPKQIR